MKFGNAGRVRSPIIGDIHIVYVLLSKQVIRIRPDNNVDLVDQANSIHIMISNLLGQRYSIQYTATRRSTYHMYCTKYLYTVLFLSD